LIAFLWAGLFFSYSQSSFVALFAVVVAIAYALGGATLRRVLLIGAAACILAGAAFVAVTAVNDSARQATSGRTRLARVTWVVFKNHPLVGVGIGGQPQASKDEAETQLSAKRDRSHTTPLTVAAELGLLGLFVYAALLAGATRLLQLVTRRNRALGLGAGAVFLALFVHSLFYAGFFEDPIVWGVMALAGWALVALASVRQPQSRPEAGEHARAGGRRQAAPQLQHQGPLAD
jgi:O-antigen ligase